MNDKNMILIIAIVIVVVIAIALIAIIAFRLEKSTDNKPFKQWEKIEQAIFNCEVKSITLDHSNTYIIGYKNNKFDSIPADQAGDIFALTAKVKDKCGPIIEAVE